MCAMGAKVAGLVGRILADHTGFLAKETRSHESFLSFWPTCEPYDSKKIVESKRHSDSSVFPFSVELGSE